MMSPEWKNKARPTTDFPQRSCTFWCLKLRRSYSLLWRRNRSSSVAICARCCHCKHTTSPDSAWRGDREKSSPSRGHLLRLLLQAIARAGELHVALEEAVRGCAPEVHNAQCLADVDSTDTANGVV